VTVRRRGVPDHEGRGRARDHRVARAARNPPDQAARAGQFSRTIEEENQDAEASHVQ
jgi:hypothetical protein